LEDDKRRVLNGTTEERLAALSALYPEKRRKVLTMVPPAVLSTPELQKQAEEARKAQQEEQQKEMRRLMPPLPDLLNPDQIRIAQRGTPEERESLFASLDPVKRQQVAGALGPQAMAGFPEMRRLGMVGSHSRWRFRICGKENSTGRCIRTVSLRKSWSISGSITSIWKKRRAR
jgi:hypothetical protein